MPDQSADLPWSLSDGKAMVLQDGQKCSQCSQARTLGAGGVNQLVQQSAKHFPSCSIWQVNGPVIADSSGWGLLRDCREGFILSPKFRIPTYFGHMRGKEGTETRSLSYFTRANSASKQMWPVPEELAGLLSRQCSQMQNVEYTQMQSHLFWRQKKCNQKKILKGTFYISMTMIINTCLRSSILITRKQY